MKLIVGLGNPGTKYAGTRHNVGFSVIVGLADKYNIELSEKKHKAIYGRGMIEGEKVILAMPQTFMNLSGESVRELVDYYKCDPSDVIVAYDDIDLAVGKLRIREKGSAGGHNGMKNIISHLGTQEFVRVRVGIGRNSGRHCGRRQSAVLRQAADSVIPRDLGRLSLQRGRDHGHVMP